MKVRELMHSVVKLPSGTTIAQAAKVMDFKLTGSVLVEENSKIIGIMTERDILRKVVAKGRNAETMKIREIMNYPLITIDAEVDALEASRIMDEKRIRRLVVTEKGQVVGKITANSISRNLRYLMVRKHEEYVRPEY